MKYSNDSAGIVIDSTEVWLVFIVYNADEDELSDPFYTRSILKPFVDSIVQHSKMKFFQMDFYKQSKKLDTTFVDGGIRKEKSFPPDRDAEDNLSWHQEDLIANYELYDKKKYGGYGERWGFSKDGEWVGREENGKMVVKGKN